MLCAQDAAEAEACSGDTPRSAELCAVAEEGALLAASGKKASADFQGCRKDIDQISVDVFSAPLKFDRRQKLHPKVEILGFHLKIDRLSNKI